MTDNFEDDTMDEKLERIEERINEFRRRAQMYDGEVAEWYAGIALGYQGAYEILQEETEEG